MAYWLMKSEPFKYSWDDLVAEGEGTWDGVRNYQARNNLAAMQVGDEAFFYHSREGLEVVGICTISVAGIMDPTDETGKWAAVKVRPKTKLAHPVPLTAISLIGVPNDRARDTVRGLLKSSQFGPKVAVYPPWFQPTVVE